MIWRGVLCPNWGQNVSQFYLLRKLKKHWNNTKNLVLNIQRAKWAFFAPSLSPYIDFIFYIGNRWYFCPFALSFFNTDFLVLHSIAFLVFSINRTKSLWSPFLPTHCPLCPLFCPSLSYLLNILFLIFFFLLTN